jgi:hypothetical protein
MDMICQIHIPAALVSCAQLMGDFMVPRARLEAVEYRRNFVFAKIHIPTFQPVARLYTN